MNLETRTAKRNALGRDPDPGGGDPDPVQDTDGQGVDPGNDQVLETKGAPEAHDGEVPTRGIKAGDLTADPETGRKKSREGDDPKLHPRATAQPGGRVVRAGDTGEVEASADLQRGLLREAPGLRLLEDTRKRREGKRTETETAGVRKTAAAMNSSTPPVRKKEVKTKNESGRGNQMERKT